KKDVANLSELFTQMGYKVPKQHIDMTEKQTFKAISEFTKDPELKDVDSCIIVIMSHGDKEGFYTKDHKRISIDYVIHKFSNTNCPLLKDKPKIFILQFCRGSEVDEGVVIYDGTVIQTDSSNIGVAVPKRDGTLTDMYFLYATVP
ncbi:unnamed protein product, partial [Meganyctiphanes norvegica]